MPLRPSTPTVLPEPSPTSSPNPTNGAQNNSPNPADGAQNNNWSYTEVPSPNLPFIKTTGLLVNINSTDPLDYFNLIAPDDFFNVMYEGEQSCN